MAENIGGIAWTVDADTRGATDSISEMDKQIKKAESSLGNLDSATAKTNTRIARIERITAGYTAILKKNGNAISSTGIVLDEFGKVNKTATVRLQRLAEENDKLHKSLSKSGSIFSRMGRNAGQAGIQVQQFIGQIQGGQSAMLALSQQSADLGFVLGAPLLGAVVGIGASLVGMLIPNLMKSKNALEEIEKATKNVRAAMTLSADGVAEYSDKMKMLKNISEEMLKIRLANLIADQTAALKIASDEVDNVVDNYRGLNFQLDLFGNSSDESYRAFLQLSNAVTKFKADPATAGIEGLESALKKATEAGINNTKKGRELNSQLIELIYQYKSGQIAIEQFNKALENTGVVAENGSKELNKYDTLLKSLTVHSESLRSKQLEIEKQNTLSESSYKKLSSQKQKAISDAYDTKIALEREKEAAKSAEKAAREKAKADAESAKSARKVIRSVVMDAGGEAATGGDSERVLAQRDAIEELKSLRESDVNNADMYNQAISAIHTQMQQSATNFADGIITASQYEIEALQKKYDLLEQYRQADLINDENYTRAKEELDQKRVSIASAAVGSFASSFGEIATILKDSEGEQSSAYKAMFALSKGFAVAQAGLNFSLALSNALASGPFPWNLGAMASVAAAGASLITSVAGASYSGREHGGSVIANQTYEVGEKNKPEMLMIPGNNGKVFSNSEMKSIMGGGGQNSSPIINNYGAADGYTVQHRRDELTQRDVFDIVQSEMGNPNSKGRRSMQRNSNLSNVLNGGRRR